mgnify:CR=1 FL=1
MMSEEQSESTTSPDADPEEPDSRIDLLISVLIGIVAIFLFIETGSFADVRTGGTDPGAAYWPRIVLSTILLACVINIGSIYRNSGDELSLPEGSFGNAIDAVNPSNVSTTTKRYFVAIALMVVYIALLTDIGFLVLTPFFVFFFLWTLGYPSMPKAAVYSIVITIFVFLLFRNVMNIALPYGTGILRDLSVFVEGLI